jgi:hypothetical protein
VAARTPAYRASCCQWLVWISIFISGFRGQTPKLPQRLHIESTRQAASANREQSAHPRWDVLEPVLEQDLSTSPHPPHCYRCRASKSLGPCRRSSPMPASVNSGRTWFSRCYIGLVCLQRPCLPWCTCRSFATSSAARHSSRRPSSTLVLSI